MAGSHGINPAWVWASCAYSETSCRWTDSTIERAVDGDKECARVLQQATACRGALEGFIAEVVEDHIREHLIDENAPKDDTRVQAAEELIEIVHAYVT